MITEAIVITVAAAGLYASKKLGFWDNRFQKQARKDQKAADYPGCAKGRMHCREFCYCHRESYPTEHWVKVRSRILRVRETCTHEHTSPKLPTLFERSGPRGRICNDCGLVQATPGGPWEERDD